MVKSGNQEACSATGGIADTLTRLGIDKCNNHGNDVARRAKLAVRAGHGEPAEQVLIHVAFEVFSVVGSEVHFVDALNDGSQRGPVINLQRGAIE